MFTNIGLCWLMPISTLLPVPPWPPPPPTLAEPPKLYFDSD